MTWVIAFLVAAVAAGSKIPAKPTPLWQVRFQGQRYSEPESASLAGVPTDAVLDSVQLARAWNSLLEGLAQHGYPLAQWVQITAAAADPPLLRITYDEGKPLVIGKSSVEGELAWRPNANVSLNWADLEPRLEAALDILNDSGFPHAKVVVEPTHVVEEATQIKADLRVRVIPGEFVRLGGVDFKGTPRASRILELESRLRRGQPFNRTVLSRAQERLERLPFVASAGPWSLTPESPGFVRAVMPVRERRANRLSGAAAVTPDAGKPVGEFKIQFGNLLNTGRRMEFHWSGLDIGRRGFQLSYVEPWIMSKPWHLQLRAQQWLDDTTGTIVQRGAELQWEAADRFFISGGIESETASTGAEGRPTRTWSGKLGVVWDGFDRSWNPGNGRYLELSAAQGRRSSGGGFPSDIRRGTAVMAAVFSLTEKHLLFTRLTTREVDGKGLWREDMIRAGGVGSVRGYPEGFRLLQGALEVTGEIRWRPDPGAFLAVFADLAYPTRTAPAYTTSAQTMIGYGWSAGWESLAGQTELHIGWTPDRPLMQGRVHLKVNVGF